MPGLLCYRQCVLSEEAGPGGMKMDQYDAMSEYHYVSKEAWQQAMATEVGRELDDDSALFMSVPVPRLTMARETDIPSLLFDAGTWKG